MADGGQFDSSATAFRPTAIAIAQERPSPSPRPVAEVTPLMAIKG